MLDTLEAQKSYNSARNIYPNYLKMPFHSTPIFIHSVVVPLYRGQPCASSRLALNKNRRTLNSAFSSSLGIEIASWKLRMDRNKKGELFLLSNELHGEEMNLSYERLFGKLIATQDNTARVIAGKTGRTISKVITRMATTVFIPL